MTAIVVRHMVEVNKTWRNEIGQLENIAGYIISKNYILAEGLNGYISSLSTKEDISSLQTEDSDL